MADDLRQRYHDAIRECGPLTVTRVLYAVLAVRDEELEKLHSELRHSRTTQAVQLEELTRHRANMEKSGCLGCMERERLRDWWAATSQQNGVQYERAKERWYEAEDKLAAAKQEVEAWRDRAVQAEAAIARVRRLCELTINASVRVQAIDQARDTLAALDDTQEDGTHVEP
jgi:hypothetical protein